MYKIIDKHFSGIYYVKDKKNSTKEFSNDIFKEIFFQKSEANELKVVTDSNQKDYKPLDHIEDAMKTEKSRFLMLFLDSEITRSLLMEELPKKKRILEQDEKRSLEFIEGSKFKHDTENQKYYIRILSRIKDHITNGDFVVLSDLDNIYGILYDLFNQRFSMEDNSTGVCQINYGDMKEKIPIHNKFGCILLKNEADFLGKQDLEKRLPSPLLNRFEKHILTLENYTNNDQTRSAIQDVKKFIREAIQRYISSSPNKEQDWRSLGNQMIHCFHGGQLIDYVCIKLHNQGVKYDGEKTGTSKYRRVYLNLMRFFSSKMMVMFLEHLQNEQISITRKNASTESFLKWFRKMHPVESLERLREQVEGRHKYSKWIVFTFCKHFYMEGVRVHSRENPTGNYLVLKSKNLDTNGFNQLEEKLTRLQNSGTCKGLIIVIENSQQYHHLSHLQKYIDKFRQDKDPDDRLDNKSIGFVVHQVTRKIEKTKQVDTKNSLRNIFYPNDLISTKMQVEYPDDYKNWQVYYIDNLEDSYYK